MTIRTVILKPESFRHNLEKTGEICTIDEKRSHWKKDHNPFHSDEWVTEIVQVDKPVYAMNFDQLDTYPEDVREQFSLDEFDRIDGYEMPSMGRTRWYMKSKSMTRDFGKTLTDFYEKNEITADKLINLEYCKDNCMIKEAWVTWEDGKE
jgi:hypothetical protein